MDAEDLLMRKFLGILTEEQTQQSALWIRSQQRSDGSWASFKGGPPELSVNVEAYVALRLAGDPADAPHMKRASQLIRDMGGLEKTRVFTRIWMALFGLWSWDDLPAMPPEMIFLPPWFPLNVYDFACWARQTVVALTIVTTERPQRDLGFTIDEIRTFPEPTPLSPIFSWAGAFERLDKVLHAFQRHPIKWLRKLAYKKTTKWVLDRQEADGCWGGIQPPWVYSTMGLHLLGFGLDHPVLVKSIAGLERFTIIEDGVRRIEACQSPVWDTALTMVALADSGIAPDHPAMLRAADWLLDEEVLTRGDWSVRRPNLAAGGWAFEFDNDNYPDVDDTAEVVLALRKVAHPDPARVDAAVKRGIAWMFGMTSKTGSWASFDADNVRELVRKLPFCDFGEVIDPPSSDVTAHVLEALAHEGYRDDPRIETGRQWLLAEQEQRGSWFGRWGANHIYGTGAAIPALAAMGDSPDAAPTRRAVQWLEDMQNSDGGWGEDMRSYVDPVYIGRGKSTASQTAWALLALLAAKENSAAVERGIGWLIDQQLEDGRWEEDEFTGTGFPGFFYINYHMYRHVFPLTALGRYLSGKS